MTSDQLRHVLGDLAAVDAQLKACAVVLAEVAYGLSATLQDLDQRAKAERRAARQTAKQAPKRPRAKRARKSPRKAA